MVTQKEMTEEAVNAAWNKFQRMPSSNPGDYAHAVVHALMPLVKRAQAEALREAHADIQAYNDSGAPFGNRPVEEFLLHRADRIEQGENDG